ncbi:hypothetical protein HYX11_01875 [Candidatus Woesearchaeota archaeon]|nr:hypothetical protein [Candidatus Woesearchaeota archaeon]
MVHQPQNNNNTSNPITTLIISTQQLHHELKQEPLNLEKIKQLLNNIDSIHWQLSPLFQEKHPLYSKAQSKLYQLKSTITTSLNYISLIREEPSQSTKNLKTELVHVIKKCLDLSLLHNKIKSPSKIKKRIISLATFIGTLGQPNIQANPPITDNINNVTITADTVKKEDIEKIAELKQLIQIDEQGDLSLLKFNETGPLCARYIKNAYNKIFGAGNAERDGVTGAAWNMPKNITKKNGQSLWNGNGYFNYNILKKGDIIGFIYKNSNFKLKAKIFGEGNTHVAIVLNQDSKGRIIIAHFFHTPAGEPDRIDYLDELITSGLFKIVNITRTKTNISLIQNL